MNAKSEPLISIVTPVYNGDAYLSECVESVVGQSYRNWEYIILNNNSSDRTLEIAEQYRRRDSRIRVYSNAALLPIIANHNKAFSLISSESKYCKVVSADDVIFPDCLKRMMELAEENPSVGIVGAYQLSGGAGVWYVRNSGLAYSQTVLSGGEVCRAQLLGTQWVLGNPTSVMYRADLVRSTDSFFPNATAEADTSACLEHLRFSDFGFVHQVLSHERIHDVRATTSSLATNAYLSAAIRDCQVYGGWYLTKNERDVRIAELLDEYYAYLARSVFKRQGRKFWGCHAQRLRELGFPLDRVKLSALVASKLLDQMLKPKETIQLALGRRRITRALTSGKQR
jgi:glycosyltransferase involved in cell wall biosynthesis